MNPRSANKAIARGIFYVVMGAYVATSPGRIDIVDGQNRYDVALHWLAEGRPVLRDPVIGPLMAVQGRDGLPYSNYGPAASVFAMPLVALGALLGGPPGEATRFLFSLTSSVFGALTAAVLYFFFRELGVSAQGAVAWTIVNAFATLVWPASTSTFDNAQHAFFAIAGVFLGFLSARHKSRLLAAAGGLVAGVLLLYQDYFVMVIPALAIAALDSSATYDSSSVALRSSTSVWARTASLARGEILALASLVQSGFRGPGEARESCVRYVCFVGVSIVDLMLSLAYNDLRFGSWFQNGRLHFESQRGFSLFGNPVAGFLTLLFSPGKSILLYSPPLILGVLGIRYLWRRRPRLGVAIVITSTILVLFISCISFAGGDWCWGPRYLVVLLPLWALAFPFVPMQGRLLKRLALGIVGLGFVVQVLALSVETQRFFFARGLNDSFWAEDPWFYFKHSALFARPGEALSLKEGLPPTVRWFSSIPEPGWSTYVILGTPPETPRHRAPEWMRQYKIFYLPRPWTIWMWWIPPDLRPINIWAWLGGLLGLGVFGCLLIHRGLQTLGVSGESDAGVQEAIRAQ